MYTKIGIPENNSLKSKIEELYEWCDKRDNDDELGKTYFNEPIDEDITEIIIDAGTKMIRAYFKTSYTLFDSFILVPPLFFTQLYHIS